MRKVEKGDATMNMLSKEYALLFNAITDTEEALRQLREDLIAVQRNAEELFLSAESPEDAEEETALPEEKTGLR